MMRFLDYYKRLTTAERAAFAKRVGTSVAYLSQLAHGHRRPGGALTLAILRETHGAVAPREDSFGPPPPTPTHGGA
jgi:DNA-binding transcriptional regulator YdaS (Cro superfamily)